MPASAGRVRMPHNNRMSTSATLKTHSIWQTAIGHDPYANETEKEENARDTKADAEKLEKVMEMAKSQNVTEGRSSDDFTARMYLGLKRGKQRRGDAQGATESVDPRLQGLLEAPSSSSEEEYVEVEVKKDKKKKSSKKRKRQSYSSSESSSDESDRYERKRKKEKRRKRKKKSHKKSYRDSYDSSDSEDRRRRREKKRRSEEKKRSRREHKDSRRDES